jgi:predicted ATP-binding protein involved in virulence
MRINSIKIERLFEIFDYNISFNDDENVLIVTGPNGFGKTMILNILYNLFNRNLLFFQRLVFEKITVFLQENISIIISKKLENDRFHVKFTFSQNGVELDVFDYSDELDKELIKRSISRLLHVERLDENTWIDHRTNRVLNMDILLNEYADQLPEEVRKNILKIKSPEINKILDSIKVHLIREQRLFKKVPNTERNYQEETIQTYAKELERMISLKMQESYKISQQLDSSYPDRLVNEKKKLTESEYKIRFAKLIVKQEKLAKNGLYENKQRVLGYSQEDSKALLVYLNDLESKLEVFDDLLERLELFTNILNERRFTYKTIQVDRVKGFYFKTSKGKELQLNQLSSGEQHEVVILYELIFNAKQNTLVLIDEPEISLHITWQKEFLNDLLKIIKIQNIQVIIATHAPSIINDRWDLVYNLENVHAK